MSIAEKSILFSGPTLDKKGIPLCLDGKEDIELLLLPRLKIDTVNIFSSFQERHRGVITKN
jgi:hypothetical protein